MTPSKRCADFIKGFEKCRLKAYLPTPQDVPTIGWGATGPDIRMGMTWTQEQADDRFAADLARFGSAVAKLVHPGTKQGEFDAMVSLAFNIGIEGFRTSSARRLHNEGDREGAADKILLWNKQKGRVLKGLTRRRNAEREMYLA